MLDAAFLHERDHPAVLAERQVLDQPGQAELADTRSGLGLFVGQAMGGVTDPVSLLGQERQQGVTLVDDGRHGSWHGFFSDSAGRAGTWWPRHGAPPKWPWSGHFEWG